MTGHESMKEPPVSILLVDDRPENLLALEATLGPLGLNLVNALSGDEAMRHLLHGEFAAILLDVQMPGMSGFELAAEIRKSARFRGVPIIFLTAIDKHESHVAKGYAEGAVDYLFKPLSPDILRAKVSVFADLYRKTREINRQKEELGRLVGELNRSNEELTQFAYVASHDLQAPLRKASAFATCLSARAEAALDAESRGFLLAIVRSIDRMQNLIDSLLRLAKAGSQPPVYAAVDLEGVTRLVKTELEPLLSESGGSVEVGHLPPIKGDAAQLRQLMQNLIGNAIKFRKQGSPPAVRVWAGARRGGLCDIHVKDNGVGFAMKDVERMFEPFERLHSSVLYPGAGIGLAICRKIVQRHGGTISAKGALGKGACLTVSLPLADVEQARARESAGTPQESCLSSSTPSRGSGEAGGAPCSAD